MGQKQPLSFSKSHVNYTFVCYPSPGTSYPSSLDQKFEKQSWIWVKTMSVTEGFFLITCFIAFTQLPPNFSLKYGPGQNCIHKAQANAHLSQ